MKNVTPKAGQVWEHKITKMTYMLDEANIDYTDPILLHKHFTFIPQNDLEWLAVNVDEWKGDGKYISKPGDVHILRDRSEWQNMRYELGLDEKPTGADFKAFAKGRGIAPSINFNCPCATTPLKKETKMKAKIQKVELFNIEINGVTHNGFEKVESWKGLACYKNKDGQIIANDFGAKTPFDWISFPSDGKAEPQEIIIVSASPCFIKEQNK